MGKTVWMCLKKIPWDKVLICIFVVEPYYAEEEGKVISNNFV